MAWELSDFETFSYNLSSLIYHLKHEISSITVCVFLPVCVYLHISFYSWQFFFIFIFYIVSGDGQEEQHANTSANYDVELLHHRDAHLEFFKSGVYRQITS